VFLEWSHQVLLYMWPQPVVSEKGEHLESKWSNIMYLFC